MIVTAVVTNMLQDAEEWTARTRGATKSAPREREGRKGGAGGGRQGRPPRGRKAHAPRAVGAGMGGGAKRRGAVAPLSVTTALVSYHFGVTAAMVSLTAAGAIFVPGCRGGVYGWV